MVDIQYYLTFLTFIQVAVAFDFGMLYLDRKSKLMLIQDGWIELLRRFYPKTLGEASRQLQRCRNGMPEEIIVQRDDLKRMKDTFCKKYQNEEISRFLPGVGFLSGCFGLFLLVWLPLCRKGWPELRVDILTVVLQATLFAQILYVVAFFCSKIVRETLLGIILPMAFAGLYMLIYCCTGLLWRNSIPYDFIFYCCICVPFIPIAAYIIMLLPMILERKRQAKKIRKETETLKEMLDNRIGNAS